MDEKRTGLAFTVVSCSLIALTVIGGSRAGQSPRNDDALDQRLHALLAEHGFTGRMEERLPEKLGRDVDLRKADLGRLLFFDRILSIHSQSDGAFGNPCAGCHSPTNGMGDTQSIAIGVDTAGIVGPDRVGARNQRRTPIVINNAFYPRLMWDGRFFAPSGDPFDNSKGFTFPMPEGTTRFPANDPKIRHLLVAQAHIPVTETPEMAGFTGAGSLLTAADVETVAMFSGRQHGSNQARLAGKKGVPCGANLTQFDDGHGIAVPFSDEHVTEAVRAIVERRLNESDAYRTLFEKVYPDLRHGAPIRFEHIGQAIAEFEISLTFTDAPIDRYARGDLAAMTDAQKRGAVLFFDKAGCVGCHAVSGESNEMFTDFRNHRLGVPQIAPVYGSGSGNFLFDGDRCDQDFGAFNSASEPRDPGLKYAFRTSPLRNLATQPAFFHNGAFTRLEDAVRHHLDVDRSVRTYDPEVAGLAPDLALVRPSNKGVLAKLDKKVAEPKHLSRQEVADLVDFLRVGLLDPRAKPENLCKLVPEELPSGLMVGVYQGCND